ncbi:MAG: branched-chain amino acid aminotransferase [Bacteroidales bacterium]|nr:branched-chain amino acid aminotransferase [Bacteroidales bacterium]
MTTSSFTDIESKSRIREVDFDNLGFGNYVSDHMFLADYANNSWSSGKLLPFSNLSLAPNALALHYGQTVFEGMKAFRHDDGKISVFRIDRHYDRFSKSLQRLCMPPVSFQLFRDGILQLINEDRQWVPDREGTSLYIRPFMIATEERYGVKISEEYKFIIFAGPVGKYYSKPLRVKVEDKFMRAAPGGTGYAKCGGNYGASFYPAMLAKEEGFDQVLWTDGSEKLNIEESGTMNVMFVADGKIITPAVSDTILDGVTRDSLLTLARDMGYEVETRKISARELVSWNSENRFTEAFGTGTAAVTSPISRIYVQGTEIELPGYTENSFCIKGKKLLDDIRMGKISDKYNWNTIV